MIIMIILLTLAVLGIVGAILWHYFIDDDITLVFAITGGFAAALSVICGIICSVNNCKSMVLAKEYELVETIKLYKHEKQILESYHLITESDKTNFTSDITFETVSTENYYIMVNEYNQKIFDFKNDVKTGQYVLDNPWINWFVCKAYNSVSDEMLAELEYTYGKVL